MSEQLELFPEMMYEDFEQDGKIYRRHTQGKGISHRKRLEQRMKVKRFIDEYKKTI
tara:strand:- start:108 stop:275 length:168 start_codon:yes stop_codon:yes gene_type:complete